MSPEIQQWNLFMNVLQTFGVIGFLGLAVVAFYRGHIIPASTVETIIQGVVRETSSTISKEIEEAVKQGIERGIAAGFMRITEINGGRDRK